MDEALRAEAAKQILGNPAFELVIEEMKREAVAKWAATPARDTDGREWLWMFYQNTLKFEEVIKGYIATGKKLEFDRQQETLAQRAAAIFDFRKQPRS